MFLYINSSQEQMKITAFGEHALFLQHATPAFIQACLCDGKKYSQVPTMWKASMKAQNFAESLRILDRSYYDMDKKKKKQKKPTDNKNSKCLNVPPNDSSTKS